MTDTIVLLRRLFRLYPGVIMFQGRPNSGNPKKNAPMPRLSAFDQWIERMNDPNSPEQIRHRETIARRRSRLPVIQWAIGFVKKLFRIRVLWNSNRSERHRCKEDVSEAASASVNSYSQSQGTSYTNININININKFSTVDTPEMDDDSPSSVPIHFDDDGLMPRFAYVEDHGLLATSDIRNSVASGFSSRRSNRDRSLPCSRGPP